jgi:2-octaprenyl-6-methoxyphenol hydroxylase
MDATHLIQPQSALIVGAGPVGALLALALHQRGWQVTLIEQHDFAQGLPKSYDSRQLALTAGSVDWLKQTQLLPELLAELTPILSIHSSSQDNFGTTSMTHTEMKVPALGYTLSQQTLGQHLFAALAKTNIPLVGGINLQTLSQTTTQVSLSGADHENKQHHWQANYLFAADGAHSWIRQKLGIDSQTRHYPHNLLTAIATLAQPHNNLAIERFTVQGPTALLPMQDKQQSKVVYCYPTEDDEQVKATPTAVMIDTINHQLGRQLGNITQLEAVQHYPLVEIRANSIQQGHCLLMGNAAHTQHPVAGQGLNLGIRDIAAVYDWAQDADQASWFALAEQRQKDHKHTMNFTHGLVTLFSHPSKLVRTAASAGMGLLAFARPLKHRITRMAMGY